MQIPVSDRIPFRQKIAFSLGGQMDFLATGLTLGTLWMPFFNIGLGMNPVLVGLVLMVLRIWDALTDPLVGNLSDNARTRWGRRRPFMFVGAILTACLYPLLWRVPMEYGSNVAFGLLLAISLAFCTVFTVWSMPYYGLQMELTPNYDERTRLTAWMTFWGKIVGVAGGWVMAFMSCSLFADPETGEADIVHGMKVSSWVIAALILVLGLLPALFVKERYYEKETSHQPRDPFWQSIRESFRCGPMWCLIAVAFFVVIGNMSVASLGQYVNIYVINNGDIADASIIEGWKYTAMFAVGLATIPLWTWMSERLDKRLVMVLLIIGGMAGHLMYYFCLRPDMPYLQILPAVMQSGTIAAIWLFLPSMKADVADYDETRTRRRREGALNAFFSWFIKAALACATGASGLFLELSGFDVSLASQPEEVLRNMVWLYLLTPIVFLGLAVLFLAVYPLSRTRMSTIREELEARRGQW
ncbi:MFS transporter [Ruficoccus amylovorans]|uniref:MFS transporter n=1 Tax=Ruficoccus amylovorans TaxID=1804625 RepID=A0A842HJB5_9BACT|nr:MFS transporter [Ruficoccus amylovorans]MBC2595587.1 MFS transporter [Ruficoccus amylovorans]